MVLGGLADWAGTMALGSTVADTIKKGASKLVPGAGDCWQCGTCDSKLALYYVGMVASLAAAAIFLLLATYTALPVSTTHAIVGGVVGMSLVAVGPGCLNFAWHGGLGGVVGSWFISPCFSGIVGVVVDYLVRRLVLQAHRPDTAAMRALPLVFAAEAGIVALLVLIKAASTKHWDLSVQVGTAAGISAAAALAGWAFTHFYVRRRVADMANLQAIGIGDSDTFDAVDAQNSSAADRLESQSEKDDGELAIAGDSKSGRALRLARAKKVFAFALVFVATLESFAHGANDTANATGPFSAVYQTYVGGRGTCDSSAVPMWILAAAGFFVFLGVVTFGRRVIETVGNNLTAIDTTMGFAIEVASALTVLIASFMGWPVSTTHCQVGAVVFVGLARTPKARSEGEGKDETGSDSGDSGGLGTRVKWGLVGKIGLSWLLTLPFAGGIAAAITAAVRPSLKS